MPTFYVMTKKGTTPPKYKWHCLTSATKEAERLAALLNDEVYVLKLMTITRYEQVPVTETKLVTHNEDDDNLPF